MTTAAGGGRPVFCRMASWNVACFKNKQGLAPDWLPNELPHHGFGVFVVVLRVPKPVAEGAYCAGIEVSPPSKQVDFVWTYD